MIADLATERRARGVAQMTTLRALRLGLSDQATAALIRIAKRLVREGRSAASVLDYIRRLAALQPRSEIHA